MENHTVELSWMRSSEDFAYESYSRDHTWSFDGNNKNTVCASAAPQFHGNASCVNPEQAFVAAFASCLMLTFLAIASKRRFIVDSYADNASGALGENERKKTAITAVQLNPIITFAANARPTPQQFAVMIEQAHNNCFIANSVAQCVKVLINPRLL
ncbi:MAG: OsmC family protein [Chitinivibrionales bacterium]|nr:OsmC family protein [Chitinivibrionales bacterium]